MPDKIHKYFNFEIYFEQIVLIKKNIILFLKKH